MNVSSGNPLAAIRELNDFSKTARENDKLENTRKVQKEVSSELQKNEQVNKEVSSQIKADEKAFEQVANSHYKKMFYEQLRQPFGLLSTEARLNSLGSNN